MCLVAGVTGNVGREVAAQLLDRGEPVRVSFATAKMMLSRASAEAAQRLSLCDQGTHRVGGERLGARDAVSSEEDEPAKGG